MKTVLMKTESFWSNVLQETLTEFSHLTRITFNWLYLLTKLTFATNSQKFLIIQKIST